MKEDGRVWILMALFLAGLVCVALGGDCGTHHDCGGCVKQAGCEWCILKGSCVDEGSCSVGYKTCCVVETDCSGCLSVHGCGFCPGRGCMPGNATSPSIEYVCDAHWTYGSCPRHGPNLPWSFIILGIVIAISTVISCGLILMLVFCVRWQIMKYRAVSRLERMMEQVRARDGQGDPDQYASLAGLIRKEQKMLGGSRVYSRYRDTYLMD